MKTSIVLLLYLLHLVRAFLAASSSVTFHVLVFRVPTSEEITATRSCIIASPFCASVFLFPFPFLSRVLFAPRSLVFFLSNPRSCRSSGTSTPFERLRATARAVKRCHRYFAYIPSISIRSLEFQRSSAKKKKIISVRYTPPLFILHVSCV